MFTHFLFFLGNSGKLILRSLTRKTSNQPLTLRQAGVFLIFIPLLLAIQLIHWFAFLLDEIFFRDYRRVNISKPVFIISIPRSGTTFLHRTMTADNRFTTTQTWECLLAPSITERKVYLFMGKLDTKTGAVVSGFFKDISKRIYKNFDDIHAVRLNSPEEDYLTLLPILSSFALTMPFPMVDFFWDLGKFEQKVSAEKKKNILGFYKKMLQKHLYVHGQDKIILSKNASFSSLVPSLLLTFPDCRIICPTRTVSQAFRSQLSSVAGAIDFFGNKHLAPLIKDKFLDIFIYYCQILEKTLKKADNNRYIVVSMSDMQTNLSDTVNNIYRHFSMDMDSKTDKEISLLDKKARDYVSGHRYDLEMFKTSNSEIEKNFQDVLKEGWFSS